MVAVILLNKLFPVALPLLQQPSHGRLLQIPQEEFSTERYRYMRRSSPIDDLIVGMQGGENPVRYRLLFAHSRMPGMSR